MSVEQRAKSMEQGAKSAEQGPEGLECAESSGAMPSALGSTPNPPAVSIILPTYNRARFLPEAIQSIHEQQWTDWELIIVDDGSNDETEQLLSALTGDIEQQVYIIRQDNQGAYAARNTGLDHARGKYIAFFDSDDLWLPHHLRDCVDALETNPDVDWVYGACRVVDFRSGNTLAESSFHINGRPRPFMSLKVDNRGSLRVVRDLSVIELQIIHGLYCGLQNSLIRRRLFDDYRFDALRRNEAEDQMIVIDRLAQGYRIGYLDAIHVDYRVHDDNSSASGIDTCNEKRINVLRTMAEGYENLLAQADLTQSVRSAIRRRLGSDYFWSLGYTTAWMQGNKRLALEYMRRGIKHCPWNLRFWKTYLLTLVRTP
jgi:glycosyltransferase involved in cell wall biosynthesis